MVKIQPKILLKEKASNINIFVGQGSNIVFILIVPYSKGNGSPLARTTSYLLKKILFGEHKNIAVNIRL